MPTAISAGSEVLPLRITFVHVSEAVQQLVRFGMVPKSLTAHALLASLAHTDGR